MKKFLFFVFLFFFPIVVSAKTDITLFYGEGCPHCTHEKIFLNSLKQDYPELNITYYEVWYNDKNAKLLETIKEEHKIYANVVPYTIINNQIFVGFSDSIKEEMKIMIELCQKGQCNNSLTNETKTLPLLGSINVKETSLTLITIVLGLIDGFNPCAMWILLFLIGMLLGTKNRKRMWILGLVFLFTSGIVYLLFMLTWLKIAISMNQVIWIRNILAILSVIGGMLQLQKFLKPSPTGCSVVKNKKRTVIMNYIRKFVSEKSFFLAFIGIIVLAVFVNFIELACSAGFPLLFTQILSLNNLSKTTYLLYVFLYIICYMLDDMIIFSISMITFHLTGITNKYQKYSHLLGGLFMLIIGLLLLFQPNWLMFSFS